MSYPIAILLAISSALCWGSLSVARKSLGAKMRTVSGVAWISLWQLPVIAALYGVGHALPAQPDGALLSQVFSTFAWPPTEYWSWVIANLVLDIAANWLMLRALTISPISLTAPYLSFTPVFTAIHALCGVIHAPLNRGISGSKMQQYKALVLFSACTPSLHPTQSSHSMMIGSAV